MAPAQSNESQSVPVSNQAARWQKVEWWIAGLLTVWIVILHVTFLCHAGPLWRDEAGTISFAGMPTLGDLWQNLRYDNFPPLFVLLARLWGGTGLTSDLGYRALGFLIGLGTLGILWWCLRAFGRRAPMLVLALYAINPLAIRVGDALRPYGLGVALGLLAFTLIWQFVQNPGRKQFIAAVLAATLSVQCLYQNALLIAAFCGGAWVVTLSRKDFKAAGQIGCIALVAALSLTPYWANLRAGHDWLEISQQDISFDLIWSTFQGALAASGGWMPTFWFTLVIGLLIASACDGLRHRRWEMIYAGVILLLSTALHLAFFKFIQQPPSHWYFLTMMAPAALVIDLIAAGLEKRGMIVARIVVSFLLIVACAINCYSWMHVRQSNVDLVAAKLKQSAQPGDLIVVYPWYYGVSMQRYLEPDRWTTLPPLAEIRIHRYDLIKRAMQTENPLGPLLEKVRTTLSSGHTLWIAGTIALPQKGGPPPPILPPHAGEMNQATASNYYAAWNAQFGYFVKQHAIQGREIDIPVPDKSRVYAREDIMLLAIRGWSE